MPPRGSSPRLRPSLRTIAAAAAALLGVLGLLVAATLVWAALQMRSSTEGVIRDSRSVAIASELHVSLLGYQRLSNLFLLTGESELDDARRQARMGIAGLLGRARENLGTAAEQDLIARIERSVDAYFRERERLEGGGAELAEVIRSISPGFNESVRLIGSLREMNEQEVQAAYERARRVSRLSSLAGAVVGLLLIGGMVGSALGVRRYVLQPILDLHEAVARLRAGADDVRVPDAVSREPAELARGFNEMVEALAIQRQGQFAFLAGVAHDLRNPLAAVKMGLRALEADPDGQRRARTLAMLARQIDSLLRMLNDLLDATRIEAGNLELHLEEVELGEMAEHVVELYGPTSPEREIVCRMPGAPVAVYADPLRIEQVVSNLLQNAIKFSPAGGRVVVSVSEEDGFGVLSVSDRGVGIAEEEIPHLFEPFRRNRPESAPGSGLGLSVVRRIVSAHGGSIEVQSAPGTGATFRVRLPLLPAPAG